MANLWMGSAPSSNSGGRPRIAPSASRALAAEGALAPSRERTYTPGRLVPAGTQRVPSASTVASPEAARGRAAAPALASAGWGAPAPAAEAWCAISGPVSSVLELRHNQLLRSAAPWHPRERQGHGVLLGAAAAVVPHTPRRVTACGCRPVLARPCTGCERRCAPRASCAQGRAFRVGVVECPVASLRPDRAQARPALPLIGLRRPASHCYCR